MLILIMSEKSWKGKLRESLNSIQPPYATFSAAGYGLARMRLEPAQLKMSTAAYGLE